MKYTFEWNCWVGECVGYKPNCISIINIFLFLVFIIIFGLIIYYSFNVAERDRA
jgi:hypothetical protein